MFFCRDDEDTISWWKYLNFAAMVLITWAVNKDKIKRLSKKEKKRKRIKNFWLELYLSRLHYPTDTTVVQTEGRQIGCSNALFSTANQWLQGLFLKKKEKYSLDYVWPCDGIYTGHAQWAEYMLQALQLDGRMKPWF